ncbi:MAG: hypothetical protein J0M04_05080 [Verrucomicrobia bacterium]|nr:hypothetical protein [Verrucomicrobiota bacterium]
MGQQSNKIIKRRRRADYLKRKKEQVKQGGAVKRKAVAKKPAAEKAPAAKKPAAKKAPAKKAPAKKAPAKKVEDSEVVEAPTEAVADEGAEQAEA